MNRTEELLSEVSALWAPPPRQTVSQWARENFYISTGSEKGPFVPKSFQIEPLDAISNQRIQTIVIMSATQILKTTLMLVGIAYIIAKEPDPVMVVYPHDADVQKFSKFRLAPMLRDVPALHGLVADSKARNSQSTIDLKDFPGGPLIMTAAGSPGNLAAFPIRWLLCDEIDKFDLSAGGEGDPISLAKKRTATYRGRSKVILACSPTEAGRSRIGKAYAESDQREFYVPCHHCAHEQILKWEHVKWDDKLPKDKRPATAHYECVGCGTQWNDAQRWRSVEAGRWVAQAPFAGTAGFRISELCSPWKTLADMVADFLEKKDDPNQLRTFVNTSLCELWEDRGEAPEWRRLYERSRNEPHKLGIVPDGALFLTAGADVQRDRIEVQVKGWGRGKQSWVVDYIVREGSPTEPKVWAELDEVLGRTYPNEAGVEFRIAKMAIDTGYGTQEVYNWARQQGPGRAMAVKGMAMSHQSILGQPSSQDIDWRGKKISNGIQVWPLGVGTIKSELYGWLSLPTPTESELDAGTGYLPGYCHFTPELAEEYYEQLTAEELVSRASKATRGYTVQEWVKRRERNEALDTAVYARAAAAQVGIDRFGDREWAEMEAWVVKSAALVNRPAEAQAAKPAPGTRRVFAKFRV